MKFTLILLLALVSCQDYNSNSGDRGTYGPDGYNESDPNFRPAMAVIKSRCINCHSHRHDSWTDYKSNADYQAAGLVNPGSSNTSDIVTKIINAGGNMPPDASALPDAEYALIVKWVDEFQ